MTEKLPAGVRHLEGTLYRVRLTCIQPASGGFDPQAKLLEFRNPRWFLGEDGQPTGRGFTPEEMDDLRETIRVEGLDRPLRCRWFPFQEEGERRDFGTIQLVDGERRFRSISKLVKDGAECFDPSTHTMVPASVLYEWIDTRIAWMTDEEALTLALTTAETAVGIGTGATVGLVKHLRHLKKSDAEILTITRKSPDWLLKTEKLFGLDHDCFTALVNDKINRRVAMKLLEEENLDHRKKKLAALMAATEARLSDLREQLNDAQLDEALAGSVLVLEPDAVEKAKTQLKKAKKRVRRATANLSRPRAGISSGKDLSASTGNDKKTVPLTPAKLQKFVYEPVLQIIKDKGMAGDQPLPIDLDDVKLIKTFCDAMNEGISGEPTTFVQRLLEQHKKRKTAVPAK